MSALPPGRASNRADAPQQTSAQVALTCPGRRFLDPRLNGGGLLTGGEVTAPVGVHNDRACLMVGVTAASRRGRSEAARLVL